MGKSRWLAAAVAVVLAACGSSPTASKPPVDNPDGGGNGGGTQPPPPPPPPADPVTLGDYTFWSVDQGLSTGIFDVSADEAGNVYAAGGDAVFAKKRGDLAFKRFEANDASLTLNCDEAKTKLCPVVSVAGAAAGTAVFGLQGIGTDGDQDPDWQIDSGGADVVAYDGEHLTKTRHVWVAGVPHEMCEDHSAPPCPIGDPVYEKGRRKARQILRITVNHRAGHDDYGDVWFAGTHSNMSVLLANAAKRGWVDKTPQFPGYEDTKDVWEHDHPAIVDGRTGKFLTGESTAIAVDPLTGDPWAGNEFRIATKVNLARKNGWAAPMWPTYAGWQYPATSYLDVWPDTVPPYIGDYNAFDPAWMDAISSLSFCDDGTLWVASSLHGLAKITIDRGALASAGPNADPKTTLSIAHVPLPDGTGNSAWAVACDADGSVWVGLGWGGFLRLHANGSWEMPPVGAPGFVNRTPVRNIQIDRSASPRIVYFAHVATSRGDAGGITAYSGP